MIPPKPRPAKLESEMLPESQWGSTLTPGSTAILCDLGMVMVDFNRERFPNRFEEVLERPFPKKCVADLDDERNGFESGALSEEEFSSELLRLLQLSPKHLPTLRELWPCIFTPVPETIALLRGALAQPNTTLVVVSDTDPWRERACAVDFGLEDLMAEAVCSHQQDVRPKWEDASMWLKARKIAEAHLDNAVEIVIAIDDQKLHCERALQCGAATHAHLHTTPESLRDFFLQLNR